MQQQHTHIEGQITKHNLRLLKPFETAISCRESC